MTGILAPRWRVQRRFAVPAIAAAGLLLAWPVGWNQALLVTLAIVLTMTLCPPGTVRGPADALAMLPVGACLALGLTGMALAGGSSLGLRMWQAGSGLGVLTGALVAAIGLVVLVGARRGGRIALWSPFSVVAWVVPLAVAVVSLAGLRESWELWSRPVWEMTDWLNHGEMVVDLLRAGSLTYDPAALAGGPDVAVYPRMLHATLAWGVSAQTLDGGPAQAWVSVLAHLTAASAVATTLVLALSGLVTGLVALRLGGPSWAAAAASLVAPLVLLHPYWFQSMARSGHLTSVTAAAVVLAAVWVTAVRQWSPALRLAALIVLAFAAWHLWQPLVAVPVVLGCPEAVQWWRFGRRRVAVVLGAAVTAVALSLPLAVATWGVSSVDDARLAGMIVTAPVWATLLAGLGAAVVLVVGRQALGRWAGALASALATLGAVALLLWWAQGPSAGQLPYYPAKALWVLGLLAVAVCVAGTFRLVAAGPSWQPLAALAHRSRPLAWLALCAPVVLAAAVVLGGLSHGWGISVRLLASAPAAGSTVSLRAMAAGLAAGRPAGGTADVPAAAASTSPVAGTPPLELAPFGLARWSPTRPFADAHAAQLARSWGVAVPDLADLVRHNADAVCAWLARHPQAVRVTGPERGDLLLLASGCPAGTVRPDSWVVVAG